MHLSVHISQVHSKPAEFLVEPKSSRTGGTGATLEKSKTFWFVDKSVRTAAGSQYTNRTLLSVPCALALSRSLSLSLSLSLLPTLPLSL